MPHHNEFYLYQISYPPLDNMINGKSLNPCQQRMGWSPPN